MKRNFKLLVAVVVLAALVMTLASCDVINGIVDKINPKPHEHTYSADWSSDETNHWHAATCQDTEECGSQKSDVAPHTYAEGKCSVCGAADPNYTPVCTEHTYGAPVETKAPTCTEKGEKTLTCTACGETMTQEVAPNGHTEVELEGKAPTCTETGLSKGKKCSVCDTILTAQVEIPVTNHNYVEGECSACGAVDPNYNGPKTYEWNFGLVDGGENPADNTVIPAGTTYVNGYFTIVGEVKYRYKDNAIYCVEVAKEEKGAIEFTVKGTATVELKVASTSSSNTSWIGIIDADGNLVANNDKLDTVTGTGDGLILTYNLLPGTYRVVSMNNRQPVLDEDGNPTYDEETGDPITKNPYSRTVRVFYVKVVETPYEAPEIPESIKVTTYNSYGFNDMLETPVLDSFTAPVAGYYTFGLPAGLGLWSKASIDENPYGGPDVEFMENSTGANYTVELAEGEVFEFYVGAVTAEDWLISITYSEEAPPEPTVIYLENGENKFTAQEIDLTDGVTAYLYVYQSATYTFEGKGLYINVYNNYGMLVTRGFESVTVDLEGGMWGAEYTIIIGAETAGDYTLNVSFVAPTNLYDGENTVTVDADGADCVYYVENDGDYFFNVTGATVVVYDSLGEALTANEDGSYTLESYVQYKLLVTAETAGDYTVEVVAPIFLSTYEDTTVTVGTDSVVVFFETNDKGHYTVSGEGLTIVVTDADGNVVEAGALLPGYTTYTVTITAAKAGDYTVKVGFTAPVGSYDNPEKIESLPANITLSLAAEYDNYYYQFTASATGYATLTYTVANGTLYSATLGGVESETTTITIPVVKGMTYQVYFCAASAAEVSAALSFEAGALTEAEWQDMIVYSTIEFANGSNVSITKDWMTEQHQIFYYQTDADWNYIFKAYYSYTVTANEDGSLTLKLTYLEGNENNAGTAPAIGDIKVEVVDGEFVASCAHTYTNGVCSTCGALYVGGTFNNAVPGDLSYITNNSDYPNPSYYANGGIKFNYVNQGIQTVSFAAQTSVDVTLTISKFNENQKNENAEIDAFTFYALNANGEVVSSTTLNTLVAGDNTVTLEGEGIVAVKVIMTDFYHNGNKCCNLEIGGLSVTN